MEIDNMGDIFNEYRVLSNQLKEKEQLYDILVKIPKKRVLTRIKLKLQINKYKNII